ncbi:hypothetical protein U9R90_35485, partial [Streptomyces sp. E11-3]|uniref:hypothetical protein n=1 Tax=Streptomyces sp. E11-3 TaxID=3110112 RepID=UPI00397FD2E6
PSPSPSPSPSASASASPKPTPSRSADAAYAGRTDDGTSAVAVTLRDGKAIGYFCDGRNQESWLKGSVRDDGAVRLTGRGGAELTGTVSGRNLTGAVAVDKQTYAFTLARAIEPSGIYRATSEVRGADVDGGWIVLPNGDQVGVLNRDGKPSPAPEMDPETGTVTVDGSRLTTRPVVP